MDKELKEVLWFMMLCDFALVAYAVVHYMDAFK
jgi:hypothetical protein